MQSNRYHDPLQFLIILQSHSPKCPTYSPPTPKETTPILELSSSNCKKKKKKKTKMNEPHKLFALLEWTNKLFQLFKLLLKINLTILALRNFYPPDTSQCLITRDPRGPRLVPVSKSGGIYIYIPRVVSTQELLYSTSERPLSTSLAPYVLVILPSTSSTPSTPRSPPFPQWTLSRVS